MILCKKCKKIEAVTGECLCEYCAEEIDQLGGQNGNWAM